ncbi:MAG: thioesterase family protein [Pseudomonadota bacterium]
MNDPVRFEAQILGFDDKRLHLFFTMYHAEKHFLSATSEQMCLHVDLSSRRSAPMPAPVFERVASLGHQHQQLPKPEAAGKSIGMPKR